MSRIRDYLLNVKPTAGRAPESDIDLGIIIEAQVGDLRAISLAVNAVIPEEEL